MSLWVERFAVLSDPQIARALAAMVARPGVPHSVTPTGYLKRLRGPRDG